MNRTLFVLCILACIFTTACSDERIELNIAHADGFAPNPEQLQEYLDLRAQFREAEKERNSAEAAQIQAEIDALILSAIGKVPKVTVFTARSIPIGDLGKHDPAEARRTAAFKEKERKSGRLQRKLNRAYRDLGQEHLIGVNLAAAQTRYAWLRGQREDAAQRTTQ